MPEVDRIVMDLAITKKAKFSMIDLYRTLKAWFDLHEYSFFEREYEDVIKKDKKSVMLKWRGKKWIDDYSAFRINLKFTLKNYETIKTKQGKLVEGDLKITFNAEIETDYEAKWENKPVLKFTRGFFDKFVATSKRERYEKELKEDTHDIFNRTKSYLNLQKFL